MSIARQCSKSTPMPMKAGPRPLARSVAARTATRVADPQKCVGRSGCWGCQAMWLGRNSAPQDQVDRFDLILALERDMMGAPRPMSCVSVADVLDVSRDNICRWRPVIVGALTPEPTGASANMVEADETDQRKYRPVYREWIPRKCYPAKQPSPLRVNWQAYWWRSGSVVAPCGSCRCCVKRFGAANIVLATGISEPRPIGGRQRSQVLYCSSWRQMRCRIRARLRPGSRSQETNSARISHSKTVFARNAPRATIRLTP